MRRTILKFQKLLPGLFLLVIILPLILPLLRPGFFVSDDGEWMIIRLSAFHETLRTGQFPVRFLERLNHGYGYPVLNFLYPFPFYAGEVLHLAGLSFVNSVKALFALSFLLSAGLMYLLIEREWGKLPGLVAAAFYVWAPYRLFDVYSRGSLGEAVAFVFVPLIFHFLNPAAQKGQIKYCILAALSFAALITSHNVIAFMFLPVILAYLILKYFSSPEKKRFLINSVIFFVLSLSLSAWFWLPALYDLRYTRAGQVLVSNFRDYFISPNNFLSVVGILLPIILIFALAHLFRRRSGKTISFALVVTLLALFLSSSASSLVWGTTLLPRLVQFPWRFISVAIFFSSVILGHLVRSRKSLLLTVTVILLVMASGLPALKVNSVLRPESFYTTNDDTTTVRNEYMPKWVKNDPTRRPETQTFVAGPNMTTISRVYFPGQQVLVAGHPVPVEFASNGLLNIQTPPPSSSISIRFVETPLRLFADAVSLLALVACLVILIL